MVEAKANLEDISKMSLAERRWHQSGYLFLDRSDLVGGASLEAMLYEPVTFHLPGGAYTPDFMMVMGSGRIVFVEIKESEYAKGYRDSRSKLRCAASLYPYFTFVMAKYDRRSGVFEIEEIKPDGKEWWSYKPEHADIAPDGNGLVDKVGSGKRPTGKPIRSAAVGRTRRNKKKAD